MILFLPQVRMNGSELQWENTTSGNTNKSRGGGVTYNANCPNWKSIAFCSHTVAVAQINGKLPQSISFTKKKKPNITLQTCHVGMVTKVPFHQGSESAEVPGALARVPKLHVCFIKGNISVCIGCNNRYSKFPKPPDVPRKNLVMLTITVSQSVCGFVAHTCFQSHTKWRNSFCYNTNNTYHHVL